VLIDHRLGEVLDPRSWTISGNFDGQ
jgi:hypothetical protein